MKQRLFAALLAALLVFTMIPFAFAQTVTATEPGTDRVVYLDDTGDDTTGDGSQSAPYQTFRTAYRSLCPEGGTIKILNNYGSVDVVNKKMINDLRVHYGMIVVKGEKADSASVWQLTSTIKFAGPVTIENITLYSPSNSYIYANYNRLTMGAGILCQTVPGVNLGPKAISKITVSGGTANPAQDDLMGRYSDTWLTVESGNYRMICGGGYFDQDLQKTHTGTAYVFFKGGYAEFVSATNWGTSGKNAPGGQSYWYVSGGYIKNFYMTQYLAQAPINDCFLFYTGGAIDTVEAQYTVEDLTIFYGGKISLSSNYTGVSRLTAIGTGSGLTGTRKRESGVFQSTEDVNGARLDVVTRANVNLIPLRSGDNQTVYVSSAGTPDNPGTEAAPTSFLSRAIAALAFSGGDIILQDDYTFKATELTENCRFNEPYHTEDITIKGANPGVQLIGPEVQTREVTVNSKTYNVKWGLDLYNLRGNTTFKDLTFDFEHLEFPNKEDPTKNDRTSVTIAANFNNLVIDTGVTNGGEVCLLGGMDAQPYNHFAPFANVVRDETTNELSGYNTATITFYEPYAFWPAENSDTHITVNSNSGRWWISGFSRIAGWVTLPTSAFNVNYPGTAYITVNGGTVTKLYTSPTNKTGATGGNAVVAINGGSVAKLYDGGSNAGFGAVAGNLDITVGENATVQEYVNINTAPASFTMKVNSTYSSYLLAKNTYTQATVTTDMTAETYNDAIDMTLGFSLKNNGDNGVKIRYGVMLKDYVIDDENFTVKEFGILVKKASNTAALEWFESNEQLKYNEDKVAKSVAFLRDSSIRYYFYYPDDPEKNPNDVEYYANLSGIDEGRYQTDYVFRPYMVVTVGGEDRIVYGEAVTDSAYGIASRNGSTNEAAVKVLTAVNG